LIQDCLVGHRTDCAGVDLYGARTLFQKNAPNPPQRCASRAETGEILMIDSLHSSAVRPERKALFVRSGVYGKPWANATLNTTRTALKTRSLQEALWADSGPTALTADHDFINMRNALRASGGVARGSELAQRLDAQGGQGAIRLARLIVAGDIFSFDWHDSFWVPMFQFKPDDLTVAAGARAVTAELSAVFDGWSLALWFSQPNSWLQERLPVNVLASDLSAVLAAARADRFIATG
jgi:hypothetical protein